MIHQLLTATRIRVAIETALAQKREVWVSDDHGIRGTGRLLGMLAGSTIVLLANLSTCAKIVSTCAFTPAAAALTRPGSCEVSFRSVSPRWYVTAAASS